MAWPGRPRVAGHGPRRTRDRYWLGDVRACQLTALHLRSARGSAVAGVGNVYAQQVLMPEAASS